MTYTYEDDGTKGILYLMDADLTAGHLEYHHDEPARFVIDYIEVSPEFRGQGVARRLLDRFVDDARSQQRRIVPVCGVARKMMQAGEQYQDVFESPTA
jgi:uncharacterized protein